MQSIFKAGSGKNLKQKGWFLLSLSSFTLKLITLKSLKDSIVNALQEFNTVCISYDTSSRTIVLTETNEQQQKPLNFQVKFSIDEPGFEKAEYLEVFVEPFSVRPFYLCVADIQFTRVFSDDYEKDTQVSKIED
jgi:hypothetical protein